MVELMAVIGIIGLLAVVGVPAIKGLTGSGGRKQALAQVLGALEIARNTAISSGTNAAVIFPDQSTDTLMGGSTGPYRYRSMAVVVWNATNSTFPATMVGPWISLPQGIAFHPTSIQKNLPIATNITIRILTTDSKPMSFPAIVFQADGALAESLNPPIPTNGVTFFEGSVSGQMPNFTTKNTNALENIRITRYTGRAFPTLTSITNL